MNEEEKKLTQENKIPEEPFQTRGDPGRSDRGPTKATPEITENPAKVDRGSTSNESVELDDSGSSEMKE